VTRNGDPDGQVAGRGEQVDADVGDRADDEHVADRADAGALPERDPQQQHDGTDGC
jgi:hypothetical protein